MCLDMLEYGKQAEVHADVIFVLIPRGWISIRKHSALDAFLQIITYTNLQICFYLLQSKVFSDKMLTYRHAHPSAKAYHIKQQNLSHFLPNSIDMSTCILIRSVNHQHIYSHMMFVWYISAQIHKWAKGF
jgi:hypothetical protein